MASQHPFPALTESYELNFVFVGSLADDKVRRRRAGDAYPEALGASDREESGHVLLSAPDTGDPPPHTHTHPHHHGLRSDYLALVLQKPRKMHLR